jgi:hypothetical protein
MKGIREITIYNSLILIVMFRLYYVGPNGSILTIQGYKFELLTHGIIAVDDNIICSKLNFITLKPL